MLDKNGDKVTKGDNVTISGVIDSVAPDGSHCVVSIMVLQAHQSAAPGQPPLPDLVQVCMVPCNAEMIQSANAKAKK